jgi:hypothetical protein
LKELLKIHWCQIPGHGCPSDGSLKANAYGIQFALFHRYIEPNSPWREQKVGMAR